MDKKLSGYENHRLDQCEAVLERELPKIMALSDAQFDEDMRTINDPEIESVLRKIRATYK